MTADWSIWAFRYARSDMPRDFFGGTLVNSNKGRINNPMVYSLIYGGEVGDEKPILIDTGMKGDWSPSGKTYENIEHPDTILAKVGFAPDDIADVILTHLHFDHAGNLEQFPNATFHVQRAEYEGWREVYEMPGGLGSDTTMWPLSSMQKKILMRLKGFWMKEGSTCWRATPNSRRASGVGWPMNPTHSAANGWRYRPPTDLMLWLATASTGTRI